MTNDSLEIISIDYGRNIQISIDGTLITGVRSAEVHLCPCEVPVIILEVVPKDLKITSDVGLIVTNEDL